MTRLERARQAYAAALRAEISALKAELRALRGLLAAMRQGPGRRFWTAAELADIRRLYPEISTAKLARRLHRKKAGIYAIAQKMGLHKSAAYLASPDACRFRRGGDVGAAYRYPKGHVPANKGLRRPGYAPGRMAETQFKKGAAPHTWVPVGTEVHDEDGYLKRKVSDDRSKPSRFNWRFVHMLVWEARHGAVPPGHAVAFRNGDKTDIREENLELISRRELMARNTVHNLPPALAQVVQLRGALVRQIRRRERKASA